MYAWCKGVKFTEKTWHFKRSLNLGRTNRGEIAFHRNQKPINVVTPRNTTTLSTFGPPVTQDTRCKSFENNPICQKILLYEKRGKNVTLKYSKNQWEKINKDFSHSIFPRLGGFSNLLGSRQFLGCWNVFHIFARLTGP